MIMLPNDGSQLANRGGRLFSAGGCVVRASARVSQVRMPLAQGTVFTEQDGAKTAAVWGRIADFVSMRSIITTVELLR